MGTRSKVLILIAGRGSGNNTTCELVRADREAVQRSNTSQAGRNAPIELILTQVQVQQTLCIPQRCWNLAQKIVCAEIDALKAGVGGDCVLQGSTKIVLVCTEHKATSFPKTRLELGNLSQLQLAQPIQKLARLLVAREGIKQTSKQRDRSYRM